MGSNIGGGILAQISSVVDGVNGDLAHAKGMTSKFGAFLDAVLDRYTDFAILLGMVVWSSRFEPYPSVWIVGLFALVGSLMISYSRSRAEASTGLAFNRGLASMASRDVRLFIIMVGSMAGQVYWTLVFLAALCNFVAAWRLVLAARQLKS